jgi:hypothetical protein
MSMVSIPPLPGIEIIAVDDISQLMKALPLQRKYFTLMLAWDVSIDEEKSLEQLLGPLVNRGLTYLCAWGHRCGQVHDAADLCVVRREIAIGEADYLLMTTWHDNETLAEVLWFFETLAIPSETHIFNDFQRFVVTVGNPAWTVGARTLLANRANLEAH